MALLTRPKHHKHRQNLVNKNSSVIIHPSFHCFHRLRDDFKTNIQQQNCQMSSSHIHGFIIRVSLHSTAAIFYKSAAHIAKSSTTPSVFPLSPYYCIFYTLGVMYQAESPFESALLISLARCLWCIII